MKIAVIGAGVAGMSTAWALTQHGHEVTVVDATQGIAEATSFASMGFMGHVSQSVWGWSGPEWPAYALKEHIHKRFWPLHRKLPLPWAKTARAHRHPARLADIEGTIDYLTQATQRWVQASCHRVGQEPDFVTDTMLMLRTASEIESINLQLERLKNMQVDVSLLTPALAYEKEKALCQSTDLAGALLIPNETVINGRQWLNLLKQDAAKRGCQFQFNTTVKGLQAAGALWQCQSNNPALDSQQFQTVILCTGSIPKSLQALTQVQLPVAQLRHASITAPIKETLDAPDHVLIDPKHRTIIARTGQRIRVSCGHPINPKVDVQQQTQRLYQSLIDWFPGAIKLASGQTTVTEWASECAYLPDDLPAVGPTQHFNLWVNTAYGSKGWSLAPACAQLIAAQMSQTISEPQQKCLQSLSATRFHKK